MQTEIREISRRCDFKKFVRFPFTLYKNDPIWVPPLVAGELRELTPGENPAFEHCEAKFFLAYKDGRIAGRIAGIINHRYIELWGKKTARFHWFDFIDDHEVSGALLKEVERWALSRGMDRLFGPMGFTTFERQGILVEGFDKLPSIASGYNFEYYAKHLEHHGYLKDHDYVEYLIRTPLEIPEKSAGLAEIVAKRYNLHPLAARSRKELLSYAAQVFDALNESYRMLVGFVPLTDKQKVYFLKKYRSLILPEYTSMVLDENNHPVGFQLAIPSLSKAFRKAKGRVFPFGFLYLRQAIRNPERVELLLTGILPEFQNKGVNAFMMNELTRMCMKKKITYGETTGMLEENFKVLNFTRYYDVELNKRRRLFYREL